MLERWKRGNLGEKPNSEEGLTENVQFSLGSELLHDEFGAATSCKRVECLRTTLFRRIYVFANVS